MKFIYVANMRLLTEKAHGVQIMKMCEAFAREGVDVELVVPRRRTSIKDNPFDYYAVEKIFSIKKLPTLDLIGIIPRLGLWVESMVFSFFLILHVWGKRIDVIYSRDNIPLYFLSFFKEKLWWESHVGSWNFVVRRLIEKVEAMVVISHGVKNFYTRCGMTEKDVLVA